MECTNVCIEPKMMSVMAVAVFGAAMMMVLVILTRVNDSYLGVAGPTGTEEFVATKTRVLFNITGTMANPVKGVAITGTRRYK